MPLEKTLNKLLQKNSLVQKNLARFSGKTLEIKSRMPSLSLSLILQQDSIRLSPLNAEDTQIKSDAKISGNAYDLLALLLEKPESKALANPAVVINGDAQLVQDIYQLAQQLEIDWQDQLAFLVGDIATHQIDQFIKNAASWSQQARENTKYNIIEYLKEEAHSIPDSTEVESFYSDLDQLKLRIDRLEARKRRLHRRLIELTA
jgi:ubiquinone biosynthesis protein UbiJ|tara:strand:- start:404 stop:1015 length:612 start_codon:yes stop_codon:yes gene_type:complete